MQYFLTKYKQRNLSLEVRGRTFSKQNSLACVFEIASSKKLCKLQINRFLKNLFLHERF